jgi:cell wall-associated NlpC family hydrolase
LTQITTASGNTMTISRDNGALETYALSSVAEAAGRAAVINEALTWIGTPFRNLCDVKGAVGGVDCAMMIYRVFQDTGAINVSDPRPYNPLGAPNKEEFLDFIVGTCQAKEIAAAEAKPGDVLVWRWGAPYRHGTILVNAEEICHAYLPDRIVTISRIDDAPIKFATVKGHDTLRPVKYYSLWV